MKTTFSRRALLLSGALLGWGTFGSVSGAHAASWQTALWDDFNGTSLDTTKWTPYYAWGEGQVTHSQEYTSRNNVIVSNGTLKLRTKRECIGNAQYSSGTVSTHGKVTFSQAGTSIEIRARCPRGKGLWPSFWTHGVSTWPPEIDILEQRGGEPNIATNNYWWGGGDGSSDVKAYPLDTTQWHTYKILWLPQYIAWSVDGQEVRTVYNANVPSQDMYLILNQAVGTANQWPGAPDSSTILPADLEIDWVYIGVYK